MELPGVQEVEDTVEISRLAIESKLVFLRIVAVGQLQNLLLSPTLSQLPQSCLGQLLQKRPGDL